MNITESRLLKETYFIIPPAREANPIRVIGHLPQQGRMPLIRDELLQPRQRSLQHIHEKAALLLGRGNLEVSQSLKVVVQRIFYGIRTRKIIFGRLEPPRQHLPCLHRHLPRYKPGDEQRCGPALLLQVFDEIGLGFPPGFCCLRGHGRGGDFRG